MFTNLLKWNYKTVSGEIKKEIDILLDPDTPIDAIEYVAMQMIAHCGKVREANARATAQTEPVAPDAIDPPPERLDEV